MKRFAIALAVCLGSALPLHGTIVLFTDGTTMKVLGFQAMDASTMKLSIDGRAAVFVPLRNIERVIDDEAPSPELEAITAKIVYEKKSLMPRGKWAYAAGTRPLYASRFDAPILDAARRFNLDPALISAVIKAESDFNPRTVSNKGARGLMQLMPATAARFGVIDSFDPVANINAGSRYLRWLLDTFHGNVDLALAAYNAGEGNVWKYNGVPPFRETITYISRIAALMERTAVRTVARR